MPDEVGLLIGGALIAPFESTIDGADSPMRPDLAEERPVSHFLDPGIDRRGAVGGPVRSPPPGHGVSV